LELIWCFLAFFFCLEDIDFYIEKHRLQPIFAIGKWRPKTLPVCVFPFGYIPVPIHGPDPKQGKLCHAEANSFRTTGGLLTTWRSEWLRFYLELIDNLLSFILLHRQISFLILWGRSAKLEAIRFDLIFSTGRSVTVSSYHFISYYKYLRGDIKVTVGTQFVNSNFRLWTYFWQNVSVILNYYIL
jgi:hypothetical protein